MAVEWIDTPFYTADQIWPAVAVEVAGPGVRAMIGDPDGFTEAAHRYRIGEDRFLLGANVTQQVNAASVFRAVMGSGDGIDQIN